jgi:parvulin-like peptidyl-prolyl isomerase
MIVGGLGVLAACVAIRYHWGADPAGAQVPSSPTAQRTRSQNAVRPAVSPAMSPATAPQARKRKLQVVALVNGERITRDDLARECLRHYGTEVLESFVNKRLIARECERLGVTVTRVEVDTEIERMAERFGLPVKEWFKMLKDERGINPAQYSEDIVWPTLALRKLAGARLKVTREELTEAFETQFGPAIRARLIACKDRKKAERLRAAAVADPDGFGELAKNESEDTPSASDKGWIPPIHKHAGHKEIERAAFSMADGEISPLIHVAGQYVILKREKEIAARQVSFEQVAPRLKKMIEERKLREVAHEVFRDLQKQAKVENIFNDPAKRRRMPGVAALIDGKRITLRELAEQCIDRHGRQVLEGTISRKLLEQACKKRNIEITDADLHREIERAAAASVEPKPDGSPDVEAWIEIVTDRQGVSEEVYVRDSVWPSVALKKLVGDKVEITEEDLQKGFEANYGPRVRCLAIVLDNLRRAQQVFKMARKNPTAKHFGDLAAQYSIEPGSRKLRGQVPPIKKHGGQPVLEKEAFTLAEGELSAIIQSGDKYVILFCEGRTKPVEVDPATVRKLVHDDLYEKKLRIAMAKFFQQLQTNATVDNYLAGTSQSPKPAGPSRSALKVPTLRQVPAKR